LSLLAFAGTLRGIIRGSPAADEGFNERPVEFTPWCAGEIRMPMGVAQPVRGATRYRMRFHPNDIVYLEKAIGRPLGAAKGCADFAEL
jgi:hypothetical protein